MTFRCMGIILQLYYKDLENILHLSSYPMIKTKAFGVTVRSQLVLHLDPDLHINI